MGDAVPLVRRLFSAHNRASNRANNTGVHEDGRVTGLALALFVNLHRYYSLRNHCCYDNVHSPDSPKHKQVGDKHGARGERLDLLLAEIPYPDELCSLLHRLFLKVPRRTTLLQDNQRLVRRSN